MASVIGEVVARGGACTRAREAKAGARRRSPPGPPRFGDGAQEPRSEDDDMEVFVHRRDAASALFAHAATTSMVLDAACRVHLAPPASRSALALSAIAAAFSLLLRARPLRNGRSERRRRQFAERVLLVRGRGIEVVREARERAGRCCRNC